jgi:hypothetical protein
MVQTLPWGSNVGQPINLAGENRRRLSLTALNGPHRANDDNNSQTTLEDDVFSFMSIDPLQNDAMDEWDDMDEEDGVICLMETYKKLTIASDFFDTFFSNVGIDEKGRSVRRSPRLGSTMGSIFMPSSDGRTLRRRSARTRRK